MNEWQQATQELEGIKDAVKALESRMGGIKFSWWVPWIVGFLFTAGTGAFDAMPQEAETWWEQAWTILIMFGTWPMFLGGKIFPPR